MASGMAGHTKGNPSCWISPEAGNIDIFIFIFIFVAAIASALMFGAVLRNVLIILSVNIYYPQATKAVSSDDIGLTPADLERHVDIGAHMERDEMDNKSAESSHRSRDYREHGATKDLNSVSEISSTAISSGKNSSNKHHRDNRDKEKDGSLVPVVMDLFRLLLQHWSRSRSDRVSPYSAIEGEVSYGTEQEKPHQEGSLDEIIARNKLLSYSLNLTQRVKALQSPLLFVGGFLICAFGLWVGRLVLLLNEDSIQDNFESWTQCIFSNYFDGYSDSLLLGEHQGGYHDVVARDTYAQSLCNESPTERASYVGVAVWFYIGAFGNSIFVFCAYLRARDIHKALFMCLTCGGGTGT